MIRNVLLSLVLLWPLSALAQDIPDDPKTPSKQDDKKSDKSLPPKQEILELKEIVKGKSGLSKRVFFIIDVSGSMVGDGKIGKALRFVRTVWQSPVDEFEIAVVVFSDKSIRWDGYPSSKDDPKPAPKGWAKLPSKDVVDAAQKFLDKHPPGNGGTYPIPALEIALKEDRSDLSIVFVTDGDYSDSTEVVLNKIKALQDDREKKGLGKAVISVFGVGDAENQKNLSEIGKEYLGGFYIEKPEPPKIEKKEDDSSGPPKSKTSLTDDPEEDIFQGFPHRRAKPWEKFKPKERR